VIKHAPLAKTAVRIGYREGELFVEVANDDSRETVATGTPAMTGSAGGGRGLLGLRERVRLYDGEFHAGPRLAGGWRVTARLPLSSRGDRAAGGLTEDSGLAALPAPT
jgi:signal transduction histidine kinase